MEGGENMMEICSPPEIMKATKTSTYLLPEKSKKTYETAYNTFMEWGAKNGTNSFSEDNVLSYFIGLTQKYKSSSLWSTYSMLKSTLNIHHNVNIENYPKLRSFLRRKSIGYKAKQAAAFSPDQIRQFINQAPDNKYLATKVALIVGVMGSCRAVELYLMKVEHFHDHNNVFFVDVPETENKSSRQFTISGSFYEIVKNYRNLRPPHATSNAFFLNFQKGKCTAQQIGINKLRLFGKQIASYLKLPHPENYTGRSFRRSSATSFTDEGRPTSIVNHCNWAPPAPLSLATLQTQRVGPSNTTNSDKPSYVIVTSEQPSIDEHAYRNNLPSSLIIKSDIEIEKSDLEESSELGDAGFKNYRDVLKENENLKAKVQSLSLLVEDLKQELFLCKEREVKLEQIVQGVKELVNQDMHIVNIKQEM